MKVSITGGSGYIGQVLVNVLSKEGHEISVLSRCANSTLPSGTCFVKGDLTSNDCPLTWFLEGCEVVFHCAGETQNIAAMKSLHVDGTQRLLQAVLKEAAQKERVIHWVQLSSVGAYGFPQEYINVERVVIEDTPSQPLGVYETTKTQSDDMLIQAGKSGLLTYSIVRPSKVFGGHNPNHTLHSLGMAVRKGQFFYIGRPGAVATYVHVHDVVEVLRRCGTDPRAKGEIFNVSNDCLLEEMMRSIACSLGVKTPSLRLPESFVRGVVRVAAKVTHVPLTQERISGLVRRTRYPTFKLERVLGFTPQIPVPDAIAEAILEKLSWKSESS